jgi:hypothetical protein
MKSSWIRFFIAIVFSFQFVIPVSALAAAKAAPKAGARVGQFISVSGDVGLIRAGGKYKPMVRAEVQEGDTILTGKNATAKVMLKDDTVITIDQNSRFVMKNFSLKGETRSASIFLAFGKIIADVKRFVGGRNTFNMESPTVVAGLRGTVVEFAVVIGPTGVPTTTVTCLSGSVVISTASGTVTLVAGQTAVAIGSAAPAITTATTAAAAAGAAGGAATTTTIGAGTVAIGAAVTAAAVAAGVAATGGGGGGDNPIPTPTHHTTPSHH